MTLLRIVADIDAIDSEGETGSWANVVDVDAGSRGKVRFDFGDLEIRKGEAVVIEFDAMSLAAAVAAVRAKQEG